MRIRLSAGRINLCYLATMRNARLRGADQLPAASLAIAVKR
jgi:hypothetical protein